ncbi:LysR family transcriptional regulator [Pseudooceanicola sp. CBS1P-1]|uniref:LysR family transcriptional regulator n=1 Tax=Pseudooceanicola albus TaxID=2692189 RepID=A0A6L7G7J8_9RHOB|nr:MULTISPECIES: LysR family transcriptional regulator [Pseudooceanicola]MBT9385064.1 LysR family transcriptional regulator [Pseudooceanicola endophyticus]MXN18643.1 LysR family transcriptional regulator [Pseudooceanicola albus]
MALPSLTLLESFATTARLGSFAAAGRRLGVSASAVGKAIQRLEEEMELALFRRTTRQLELTEAGRHLLTGLAPALDMLEEVVSEARDRTERIEGPVVLTVPLVGYHLVNARLKDFLARYPGVRLDIRFADTMVDLIQEGVDLGIRNGPLRDSSLKHRRFGSYRHGLFAAPGYLAAHGTPTLETLEAHDRITFRFSETGRLQPWLARDGRVLDLSAPRLVTTAIEGARTAAVAGMGIAWLPDFILAEDLARGRLARVLEEEVDETGEFFLVWPAARALPRRLRLLIDHLVTPGA